MHEKSVETLEFPKVLAQVAAQAGFSVGRERVLALRPTPDLADAARSLSFTSEAVRLLDEQPRTGVHGAHDIRSNLVRAGRGGALTAGDLALVVSTLRAAIAVARQLGALDQEVYPLMRGLGERLPGHPHLVRRIEAVVNDEGEVLDTASPALRRLRGEVRSAGARLQQRLRTLVGEFGNALQEPIVTTRGDRYVIPVKADFRGRVRGLVHDQSASGATLFIEPLVVVELNNQLRKLQSQEQEEVERILQEVSGEIGAEAEGIQQAISGLAEYDLQLARARYARLVRGVEPRLNSEGRVVLHAARHPLLSGRVVPIDFRLGQDFTIVVITGPNTGGKTVALKTVGLLTLMAQAGLHVPARDDSELAVVEDVFADIGDEQSIEQSLSTFSSHLTRIIEVLAGVEAVRRRAPDAPPRVLVLFDELGAGTDPDEGSALARSILTYLLDRQVPTIATTHYSDLKAFAHDTAGAINASVAFDIETLSPTYELEIGLPGRSNALSIAERLGLDSRIVRGARRHLGSAGVRMEGLLHDLEQDREAAADERERAAQERAAVDRLRLELERQRSRLDSERIRILDEARSQSRRELDAVVAELAEVRARARQSDLTRSGIEDLRRRTRRIEESVAPVARPQLSPEAPPEAVEVLQGPPRIGDRVRVLSLGQVGELLDLSADGGQAEVHVGSIRLRVGVGDLQRVGRPEGRDAGGAREEDLSPPVVVHGAERRAAISPQLDMRGSRVEDALADLEAYLNDAVLAGLGWVRIVHGRGTGALRAAVREHLTHHPLVRSTALAPAAEGGDGVTVVELAT